MAYGLIYKSEFTSISGEDYYLSIYKKDYIGNFRNVLTAAQPVIHKWQTDEPKAPIKGSSLEMRLVNENGSLPLKNFYAVEDDTFKVEFYHNTDLKFTGFIVQDDCTEEVIDYTHEIILSATDNIGLLKDVILYEAASLQGESVTTTEDIRTFNGSTYIIVGDHTTTATAGDTVRIEGTGVVDGIYGVRTVNDSSDGIIITTHNTFLFDYDGSATVTVISPIDLDDRSPLTELFRLCLLSTGLELDTYVYTRLYEANSGGVRFLDDTYLHGQTFIDGDNWKSCYDVLNILLTRFKATLFQANGRWNIIRQDERRYYNNAVKGFIYNSDFEYQSEVTLSDNFLIGIDEDSFAETGLTKSILRPYRFVKETFNYKNPSETYCNMNLQKLGNLIGEFPDPDNVDYTRYEYEAKCYTDGDTGNAGRAFIRVVKDGQGEEVERYLVTTDSGTFPAVIKSQGMEVNSGSVVEISMDFRSDGSLVTNGTHNLDFRFDIQHGASPASDYRRLSSSGAWQLSPYFRYYWSPADNTNQWQSLEIKSNLTLLDGILYIYFPMYAFASQHNETYFKNIRVKITPAVNGTTTIIGHTHTDTQPPNIKNASDEEIFVDDSPRNSIQGTLLNESFTGLVQDRTSRWNVGTLNEATVKLGEITTRDELFWRRLPRTKLEGNIYGLVQDNHVSMLTAFRHTHSSMSDLNFVCGMMSIDYVNDNFSGTLWEMFNDVEAVLYDRIVQQGDTTFSSTAPNTIIVQVSSFGDMQVNDKFTILTTALAGTYNITAVTVVGLNYQLTTLETVPTMAATLAEYIQYRPSVDFDLLTDSYEFKYLFEKQ